MISDKEMEKRKRKLVKQLYDASDNRDKLRIAKAIIRAYLKTKRLVYENHTTIQ